LRTPAGMLNLLSKPSLISFLFWVLFLFYVTQVPKQIHAGQCHSFLGKRNVV